MKKSPATLEEKFETLKNDEEIKKLKENVGLAEKSQLKDNLRSVRSKIEAKIRDILKPNYLGFHTADGLITIGFTQENGKVRYSYLDQNELSLKSEPIYSCQTQFNKGYALVQNPDTLVWTVIDTSLNKVDELHDYNGVAYRKWESKDFFELRIRLSNYLRTFEQK